jgi:hypothetical protein
MSQRSRWQFAVVLVASAALALVGVVGLLAPGTVRGQAAPGAAVSAPAGAFSSSSLTGDVAVAPGEPMSRIVPYPYPYPLVPISRGHLVIVPFWCNWPTPVPPTAAPGAPTRVPATPIPSPTPGGMASAAAYTICPQIARKVPLAVQQQALAAPWTLYGYNMRLNPNTPYHPLWNPLRTQLGLLNPNLEYHPCNPVVWKAACP